MDSHTGECRICGFESDLIEGLCQECSEYLDNFEKWNKKYAKNCSVSDQDRELFVAYLRSKD